jgi:hypothetical protein
MADIQRKFTVIKLHILKIYPHIKLQDPSLNNAVLSSTSGGDNST